jgi:hypothetical protein
MTIPTTNIALANNIYGEANGGYPGSGVVSLNDISFYSYFAGPNGTNSISYNAYGKGENSGLNRILGTNAVANPDDMDDFKGITYFYDNSSFQVTLNVTNNKTNPPPFPPPPVDNAVNVNVELFDSSLTIQYMNGGGMAMAPGSYGPASISQTNDPIIFRGYWKVTVTGANPSFAGGTCNISINGTSKVSGGSIPSGSGGATFDSATYGTEDVVSYGGYIGLYFDITVN